PVSGNALVDPYTDVSRGIFACRAVLPPATDEPVGLPGGMADLLPGAVRLFPQSHRYLMNRVVWDGLLDELTDKRVPVLLSTEHGTNWDQVYELLRDYPELTCVICDIGTWSMDRYTYPLLKAYPNVHIETSMLSMEDGGVEAMVRRFGAERLVFGTGFPRRYAEASTLQLTHADISDADKQAVAADNMLRLIRGKTNG
ncbi:amidohydrolase family protein, partial [Candidatus Latescibacterota bacterium]